MYKVNTKTQQLFEFIDGAFSPESIILDEKIEVKNNLVIIQPKLIGRLWRELFINALGNIYGGWGAGMKDEYDDSLSIYFYIENDFLRGGIYNKSTQKKITCTINMQNPIGLDETYINKRRMDAFAKIYQLLK